eukprot:8109561-Pyramimonas_sp.AAC.1
MIAQRVLDAVYQACCIRGLILNAANTVFILAFRGKGSVAARLDKNGDPHLHVRSAAWDFQAKIVTDHRVLGSFLSPANSMATEIVARCHGA